MQIFDVRCLLFAMLKGFVCLCGCACYRLLRLLQIAGSGSGRRIAFNAGRDSTWLRLLTDGTDKPKGATDPEWWK